MIRTSEMKLVWISTREPQLYYYICMGDTHMPGRILFTICNLSWNLNSYKRKQEIIDFVAQPFCKNLDCKEWWSFEIFHTKFSAGNQFILCHAYKTKIHRYFALLSIYQQNRISKIFLGINHLRHFI